MNYSSAHRGADVRSIPVIHELFGLANWGNENQYTHSLDTVNPKFNTPIICSLLDLTPHLCFACKVKIFFKVKLRCV